MSLWKNGQLSEDEDEDELDRADEERDRADDSGDDEDDGAAVGQFFGRRSRCGGRCWGECFVLCGAGAALRVFCVIQGVSMVIRWLTLSPLPA